MNIKSTYIKLYRFLTTDIWSIRHNEVSPIRFFMYTVLKKLILAVEFTTTKRITSSAAALTYSTLLAIVPILAVVFAIARGFGYNKYIEAWFRESLSSQPQAAETIIGFVNSYLVHTKSGLFLGIGLIFMLFTVIMLVSNIEQTFNYIWQVKKPRSVFRTITDYTSMFLLVPLVIVITSGISIFFATIFQQIEDTMLLGPIMQFFLQLMPYVIMSGVFVALYVFMPNTKVKIKCAVVPGVLAGFAMQGLQLFYIHSQIWVSSYNAIYGSFAALPMFMLWVQISWLICLFGAELCYASQNMQTLRQRRQALLSPRPQAANGHSYTYSQRAVVRIVANTHPNRNNKWRQRRDNPLPTSRMSHPSFCRNNHRSNGSIRQVDIRYRYETACLPCMEKDNCKPKRISNRTKTSDA